jgi:cation transport regulator ChaC
MYYFAYGSCMNELDFSRNVKQFTRLGRAELHHYKLGFTMYSGSRDGGVADVIDFPDEVVEGILYVVDEQGVKELDKREGHPNFYERIYVDIQYNGQLIERVVTYQGVNQNLHEYAPSSDYSNIILVGARNELSERYLEKLESHIHYLCDKCR